MKVLTVEICHQDSKAPSNTKKKLGEPLCLSAFVARKSSHQDSKSQSNTKKKLGESSCLRGKENLVTENNY